MSELRFTETNAADDSTGRAFGLDGDLYLPVAVAGVVAVGVFGGLGWLGVPYAVAGAVAVAPLAAALAWTVGLKQGKPKGHDRDQVEAWLGDVHFSPLPLAANVGREHERAPDGRCVQGFVLFGSPERGGVAAKGFRVEPPDLRGASVERLNAFQDQVRMLLAMVGPGRRLQCQWSVDPDYRAELLRYQEATSRMENPAVRKLRNARFTRAWARMHSRELRRERLVLFLSIEIAESPTALRGREGLKEDNAKLFQQLAREFEEFAGAMRAVFGGETLVTPLEEQGHGECWFRFLNPGFLARAERMPEFDPALSLQENCWRSEGVGQPQGGFYLDGNFHAVLALSRWPQRTRPGIVVQLTGLPFLDYAVTVNVTPIAPRLEIGREEKQAERLRGEYAQKPRGSLLVALRKKERKVEQLSGGFARPFHVTYVIRAWAPTVEALREKVAAVQAAVQAMDGAQYLECTLPSTAKKLFFSTWPGWTHSSYRHRELYAEDACLADMLPFSATFCGALGEAEALYEGGHGNLVGVSTQAGGSPQHAVISGMTGVGKSSFVSDLLWQTADLFDYTLIVEEGLSYRKFTEAMGEAPMVVHPDSTLTLNFLDTQQVPLSQLHLSTAVALLARMVGEAGSAERLALRQAQLTQYLHRLYRETFEAWSRREPARSREVARMACAAQRWKSRLPGASVWEVLEDLRERATTGENEALACVAGVAEEDSVRFGQDAETSRLVVQAACAYYRAEEYPTLSDLVALLAEGRFPEHPKEEIDRLATLLRAWSAEGQYGRLFDGVTTVSLARRVAHFELGLVPEQATELKSAVGLLISGIGRQHILSLPRARRKRILFEELARFLDTPGGEQIVAEGYAQLRKHNCWCASIIQQYGKLKSSRVRGTVVGNAKLFFFMRQADRADLVDLAQDLPIPETAIEAIQRYPLPEQQLEDGKFSSLCYFAPTAQPPQCGTMRFVQPPEERDAA